MVEFPQETRAQLVRWLIHLAREPFNLAFNLLNPVILFTFVGGAFPSLARDAAGANYRAYLLPRIPALTTFGNSMTGGIPLLFDKENGFLLRLMTAPISRGSIIIGRFLAVNISTMLQCLIILTLGLLFGIRIATGLGGVATLLLIALLLGFGVTVISSVLAFVLESHGDFLLFWGSRPFLSLSSPPPSSLWIPCLFGWVFRRRSTR